MVGGVLGFLFGVLGGFIRAVSAFRRAVDLRHLLGRVWVPLSIILRFRARRCARISSSIAKSAFANPCAKSAAKRSWVAESIGSRTVLSWETMRSRAPAAPLLGHVGRRKYGRLSLALLVLRFR